MKYFEIKLAFYTEEGLMDYTKGICITGTRKPSILEAAELCQDIMEELGSDNIVEINEISYEDAVEEYGFDDESEDFLEFDPDDTAWQFLRKFSNHDLQQALKVYKASKNDKAVIKAFLNSLKDPTL